MFGVLFSSAENFEESVLFEKALKAISNLYSENKEFKSMVLNPGVTENEKMDVIKSIAPEYFENEKFTSLILQILKENKISEIENVSEAYAKMNLELKRKIDTINEKFPEYSKNAEFTSFLTEMLRKDRIDQIESNFNENSKAITTSNKELDIKIVVASELNENQINEIVKKFKEMYKANTVNYTVEIDKSIIGGIKVCVGNTIYDSTIETRLRQMF